MAKVETVTEEHEIHLSDMSSSNSSQTPKHGYSETFSRAEQGLEHDPHIDGIDWMPGVKHQFPWIGFAGLIVVFVATVMAVTILVSSNLHRVNDWPFTRFPAQPNVLLNIAHQVQNLGLITLIGQGLAIAWWRKALRGSSLKTLHKNHAYSYSFYAIVTSSTSTSSHLLHSWRSLQLLTVLCFRKRRRLSSPSRRLTPMLP
jgi:hypothetical protein